jgi:hypothetical protein
MMNVVKGAVNTMIVCWADSPRVFEMNHPQLTAEMSDAWGKVFPNNNVQLQLHQRPEVVSTTSYHVV